MCPSALIPPVVHARMHTHSAWRCYYGFIPLQTKIRTRAQTNLSRKYITGYLSSNYSIISRNETVDNFHISHLCLVDSSVLSGLVQLFLNVWLSQQKVVHFLDKCRPLSDAASSVAHLSLHSLPVSHSRGAMLKWVI